MKSLLCERCGDLLSLDFARRACRCGAAWGEYMPDGWHAQIGGAALVVALNNRFLQAPIGGAVLEAWYQPPGARIRKWNREGTKVLVEFKCCAAGDRRREPHGYFPREDALHARVGAALREAWEEVYAVSKDPVSAALVAVLRQTREQLVKSTVGLRFHLPTTGHRFRVLTASRDLARFEIEEGDTRRWVPADLIVRARCAGVLVIEDDAQSVASKIEMAENVRRMARGERKLDHYGRFGEAGGPNDAGDVRTKKATPKKRRS